MDTGTARFPMTVAEFVRGGFLRRADVVLERGHRLFSHAIRYATDSPFSHAALIFLVPEIEQGFDHAFLLEAVPKGVSVSRVSQVTDADASGSYAAAIAILRFKAPWFSDDVARVVRGHMLNFIAGGYDWRTVISIATSVLGARLFGRKEEVPHAFARALIRAQAHNGRAPANFICSGFVQYGYLRTAGPRGTDEPPDHGGRCPDGDFQPAAREHPFAGHAGRRSGLSCRPDVDNAGGDFAQRQP